MFPTQPHIPQSFTTWSFPTYGDSDVLYASSLSREPEQSAWLCYKQGHFTGLNRLTGLGDI